MALNNNGTFLNNEPMGKNVDDLITPLF